jgi:hypothetical protein
MSVTAAYGKKNDMYEEMEDMTGKRKCGKYKILVLRHVTTNMGVR